MVHAVAAGGDRKKRREGEWYSRPGVPGFPDKLKPGRRHHSIIVTEMINSSVSVIMVAI